MPHPTIVDVAATIVVSLGEEVVLRGQTRELRLDGPNCHPVGRSNHPWRCQGLFKYRRGSQRTRLPGTAEHRSDRAHTCSSARASALLLPFLGQAGEDQPLKCWRSDLQSPCRRFPRCGPGGSSRSGSRQQPIRWAIFERRLSKLSMTMLHASATIRSSRTSYSLQTPFATIVANVPLSFSRQLHAHVARLSFDPEVCVVQAYIMKMSCDGRLRTNNLQPLQAVCAIGTLASVILATASWAGRAAAFAAVQITLSKQNEGMSGNRCRLDPVLLFCVFEPSRIRSASHSLWTDSEPCVLADTRHLRLTPQHIAPLALQTRGRIRPCCFCPDPSYPRQHFHLGKSGPIVDDAPDRGMLFLCDIVIWTSLIKSRCSTYTVTSPN